MERTLHNLAPSRTALGAAAYRAAHQVLDKPVVFADPLAIRILGPEGAAALERQLDPGEAHSWRRMRAFIAARSRFTEEALEAAVRNGLGQFVVLGAGLVTFAYRNPYGPRLAVFEVDHPATQAFKRAQLAAAGIEVPDSLAFVPVDFERQSLLAALEAAGFRRHDPALFSWLGVTMYLDRERVLATLAAVARGAGPGTEVIFDYVLPPASVDASIRPRYEALMERAAAIGEPWRSFFDPHDLDGALRRSGFAEVRDWDGAALNARYFFGRADGLEVSPTARVIAARV
jgi:methyltransferase (TIGR00027 family)